MITATSLSDQLQKPRETLDNKEEKRHGCCEGYDVVFSNLTLSLNVMAEAVHVIACKDKIEVEFNGE